MSLFTPLVLIVLSIIYYKSLLKLSLPKLFLSILIFLAITLPFIYKTTIEAPDVPRISQIGVFSDPLIPIMVQRNRELDSGDLMNPTVGKQAVFSSFIFHNKVLSTLINFFKNYGSTFSTEFLFIKGAAGLRESVGGMGQLYFVDIIGLIAGLSYLGKNIKKKEMQFLLALLLVSPIPASL